MYSQILSNSSFYWYGTLDFILLYEPECMKTCLNDVTNDIRKQNNLHVYDCIKFQNLVKQEVMENVISFKTDYLLAVVDENCR